MSSFNLPSLLAMLGGGAITLSVGLHLPRLKFGSNRGSNVSGLYWRHWLGCNGFDGLLATLCIFSFSLTHRDIHTLCISKVESGL